VKDLRFGYRGGGFQRAAEGWEQFVEKMEAKDVDTYL
jgi:hypothetical protein